MLRFVDVLEYSFNYDIKNYFYNIEDYKLLISDESAYVRSPEKDVCA